MTDHAAGFKRRMKSLLARVGQVGGLVPGRLRRPLFLACLLELAASGSKVAMLAILADLIRGVQGSLGPASGVMAAGALFGRRLALLGLVFLTGEACRLLARNLVQRAGARLGADLTVALTERLHHADLAALRGEPIGQRLGRLTHAARWAVRALDLVFLELLPAACTALFALAYALATQPWVGLVLLGVVPVMMGVRLRQMTAGRGARAELLRCKDRLDGRLVELFGGIEYVRAADTADREVARAAVALADWRTKQLRHDLRTVVYGSLQVAGGWLFQFAVIAAAVALCGLGRMPVTDIAIYGNLFFSVYVPLWRIHYVLEEARENGPRVDDLLAGLAEPRDQSFADSSAAAPLEIAAPAPPAEALAPGFPRGTVLFETRNVVVEYRGPLGVTRALDGVSLKLHAGEVVALAGRSGCGKSTVLRVLLRLAHPSSGEARLLGAPLARVGRRALARLVGYVGQEPFVFAGTVAQNIAYGAAAAPEAAVRRAAERAGLGRDLAGMPGGYAAAVGERGAALSGGQRQRLALARVLLGGAPLLALDEATSALDAAAERHALRAARATARRGGAVLLAAHRPRALRLADRVLVLDRGRIVEEGTYDQLLQSGGHLARLVREHDRRRPARRRRSETPAPSIPFPSTFTEANHV